MPHPCRTGNPGTTMHACISRQSTRTLCGLPVDVESIEVLAGYEALCAQCFPPAVGATLQILRLDRDNPSSEDVPEH